MPEILQVGDNCCEDDRMLPDVYIEGIRSPAANCLYERQWYPSLSQCSGSPRPEGMASNISWEVLAETGDKPSSCWDCAISL